jgi:hypothetical protein
MDGTDSSSIKVRLGLLRLSCGSLQTLAVGLLARLESLCSSAQVKNMFFFFPMLSKIILFLIMGFYVFENHILVLLLIFVLSHFCL